MPIFELTLIERRSVAQDTVELIFEKPANLIYKPGQYAGFTLIQPKETDAGGITRRFSLLSAPHQNAVIITTRIQSSAYKRTLNTLQPGDKIKFAGPTGNFVLDEGTHPVIFIAGGIGITPFYSMLMHAMQQQSKRSFTLFYGNQSQTHAAYIKELKQLAISNPNFQFIPVMVQAHDGWQGETGYINHELLKKNIADLSAPIYYICGSPAMVNALHKTLTELDIPEDRIKIEDFPGY